MKKTFVLIALVIISACVSPNVSPNLGFKQTASNKALYYDRPLEFRSDLNEAKKILILPNETALLDALTNPFTTRVVIAFIDIPAEDPYYAVSAFELSFVLTAFHNVNFPNRDIKAFNFSSIDEASRLANVNVPIIMLVGPSLANKTAITVDKYFIMLEAKDFSETNRTYTDLDLDVAKLLLVLLESNNG